jgi:hypothetical protein
LLVIDIRLGFNPVRLVRPPRKAPEPPPAPTPSATPRPSKNYYENDPLLNPGDPPADDK